MPSDTTPSQRDKVHASIVTAAERLLRDGGRSAVTTRAVAGAAGVQAPTIYRLFGDKDGLLEAVAERVMSTYVTTKAAPGASATVADDPVEDLRASWSRHIEFGLANPELFVLLVEPGRARRSAASRAGLAVLRQRIERLAAAGLLQVEQDLATSIVHSAGTGVILALLAQDPAERQLTLSETTLEAVLGRIVSPSPARSSSDTTSLAIAFATHIDELPELTTAERRLLHEWIDRSVLHLQTADRGAS